MRLLTLAASAVLFLAAPLAAQRVDGRLVDFATSRPVPEATITALTTTGRVVGRTRSDTAGVFSLELPRPGAYQLRAERIGFRSVTSNGFDVSSGEEVAVDFTMATGAVQLEPLTVTSRASAPRAPHLETAGFYERERLAPGTFVRRDAIKNGRFPRVSDVLARVPGARRVNLRGRQTISIGRSGGGAARVCLPAVIVDGQPLMAVDIIDDVVHVDAVEAIEIYRGPGQTPARFNSMERGCGVVVIWTQARV